MTVGTLTFNLEEEYDNFKDALNGTKYKIMMEDFWNQSLRKRTKYESDNYSEKELELLEKLKEEFIQLRNEINNE